MIFNDFFYIKITSDLKNKNQTVDTKRAEHDVELKNGRCDPIQPQNAG